MSSSRVKDFFDASLTAGSRMREEYFKFQNFVDKGKVKLKKRIFGGGKEHYDFDNSAQQYYYEKPTSLTFEKPEVQQFFYDQIPKIFQQDLHSNLQICTARQDIEQKAQKILKKDFSLQRTRVKLTNHFKLRIVELRVKKLRTVSRFYNYLSEDTHEANNAMLDKRLALIDSQIKQTIGRINRLQSQQQFDEAMKTIGKRPIPINDAGNPIYKQFDDEESCLTNMDRDDFEVFARRRIFEFETKRDFFQLMARFDTYPDFFYYPAIVSANKDVLGKCRLESINRRKFDYENYCELFSKPIENLKNPIQGREKIENFLATAMRLNTQNQNIYNLKFRFCKPPTLPSYFFEFQELANQCLPFFFKDIKLTYQLQDSLVFKLNHFTAIIYKYQCQEIKVSTTEGDKKGRMPVFEDDIDLHKELCTTLQQSFVKNNILRTQTDWDFYFTLQWEVQAVDWDKGYRLRNPPQKERFMTSNEIYLQLFIDFLDGASYSMYRSQMKKYVEEVVAGGRNKLLDMRLLAELFDNDQSKACESTLRRIYNPFEDEARELDILKDLGSFSTFFLQTCETKRLHNPSYLEALYNLYILKTRQLRRKIMSFLNGMAAYRKRLISELPLIMNLEPDQQFDDRLIIDANKQDKESFEKKYREVLDPNNSSINAEQSMISSQKKGSGSCTYIYGPPPSASSNHKAFKESPIIKKHDKVKRMSFEKGYEPVVWQQYKGKQRSVLYSCVLQEIKQIEKRAINHTSFFIHKMEKYLLQKEKGMLVDRVKVLYDYFDWEAKFQQAKFELMQEMMRSYQHTVDPLALYSLTERMLRLNLQEPVLDSHENYINNSFSLQIDLLNTKKKLLSLATAIMDKRYQEHTRQFHSRLKNVLRLGLVREAVVAKDVDEKKDEKDREKEKSLSRKNSMISQKNTMKSMSVVGGDVMADINEVEEEEVERTPDLQNYDQYMLTRNMDELFQQIVKNQQATFIKKQAYPQQSYSLQNNIIHRRFEGGPHFLLAFSNCKKCQLTSEESYARTIDYPNFYEYSHNVMSMLDKIEKAAADILERYGRGSQLFTLATRIMLFKQAIKDINLFKPKITRPFLTEGMLANENELLSLVQMGSNKFKHVVASSLQPVSTLQHDQSLGKVLQALTSDETVMQFDFKFLHQLCKLEKPSSMLKYRQASLLCNCMCLLSLGHCWERIQFEQKAISKLYKQLAKLYTLDGKKYGAIFSHDELPTVNLEGACYEDSITQLKHKLFHCQLVNEGARAYLRRLDRKVEPYMLLGYELQSAADPYRPQIFQYSRVDMERLYLDSSNLKKCKSRLDTIIAGELSDYRKSSFLKFRADFKKDLDEACMRAGLVVQNIKFQGYKDLAKTILRQKMQIDCHQLAFLHYCYQELHTFSMLATKVDLYQQISFLDLLRQSVPLLDEVLLIRKKDEQVQRQIMFDQRRSDSKKLDQQESSYRLLESGKVINPFYLLSRETIQLADEFIPLGLCENIDFQETVKSMLVQSEPQKGVTKKVLETAYSFQEEAYHYILKLQAYFRGSKRSKLGQHLTSEQVKGLLPRLLHYYKALGELLLMFNMIVMFELDEQQAFEIQDLRRIGVPFSQLYPSNEESHQIIYQKIKQMDMTTFLIEIEPSKGAFKKATEQAKKIATRRAPRDMVHTGVLQHIEARVRRNDNLKFKFTPMIEQLRRIEKYLKHKPFNEAHEILQTRTRNLTHIFYLSVCRSIAHHSENTLITDSHHQIIQDFFHPYSNAGLTLSFTDTTFHTTRRKNSSIYNTSSKLTFMRRLFNRPANDAFHRLRLTLVNIPVSLPVYTHQIEQKFRKSVDSGMAGFKMGEKLVECEVKWHLRVLQDEERLIRRVPGQVRNCISSQIKDIAKEISYYFSYKELGDNYKQLVHHERLLLSKMLEQEFKTMAYLTYVEGFVLPFPPTYSHSRDSLKDKIDTKALLAFDNLEQYLQTGRLVLTKQQKDLITTRAQHLTQRDHSTREKVTRMVIYCKILREEWICEILNDTIKRLSAERNSFSVQSRLKNQKKEKKGVFNPGLVPRVRIVPCLSSPLLNDRRNYIAAKYRIAFVQAFINRLRNKVSRVDLLSSGFGFVVTVNDLEDCINFLNKTLFSFAEKEFKYRMDTFAYFYDMLVSMVNDRNRQIKELKAQNLVLKERLESIGDGIVIKKVGTILMENYNLRKQLNDIEHGSKNLEERTRRLLQIEYAQKIKYLSQQNQTIHSQHKDFKQALTMLTRFEVDLNSKTLASTLLKKTAEVTEQRSEAKEIQSPSPKKKQSNTSITKLYDQLHDSYRDSEGDPYQIKGLLAKMRIFSQMKLATQKSRSEAREKALQQKLHSLQVVHDHNFLSYQSHAELTSQLTRVQGKVADLRMKTQTYKSKLQSLQAEKSKLQFMNIQAKKKIEKGEKEIKKLALYEKYDIEVLLAQTKQKDDKIAKLQSAHEDFARKLQHTHRNYQSRISQLEKSIQYEKQLSERKAKKEGELPFLELSDKDVHWKQKCYELHGQNIELKKRLEQGLLPKVKTQGRPKYRTRGSKSIHQSQRI